MPMAGRSTGMPIWGGPPVIGNQRLMVPMGVPQADMMPPMPPAMSQPIRQTDARVSPPMPMGGTTMGSRAALPPMMPIAPAARSTAFPAQQPFMPPAAQSTAFPAQQPAPAIRSTGFPAQMPAPAARSTGFPMQQPLPMQPQQMAMMPPMPQGNGYGSPMGGNALSMGQGNALGGMGQPWMRGRY